MRATALVCLVVGVLGCGEQSRPMPLREASGGRGSGETGYEVRVPSGWHRSEGSLSPSLVDPREILAIATFRLRAGEELCGALQRVPPAGAFVTIQERGRGAYGQPGFPSRPVVFEPDPDLPGTSTWPYCAGGDHMPPIPMVDYWFGFSDAGRAFHVFVGVGKDAPADVTREAFGILNSLRFDPSVTPNWRSSG